MLCDSALNGQGITAVWCEIILPGAVNPKFVFFCRQETSSKVYRVRDLIGERWNAERFGVGM